MTVTLSGDWQLTTDRPESSYGVPVLVSGSGDVYGPGDVVDDGLTAAEVVEAMGDGYDEEATRAIARFLGWAKTSRSQM